MSDAPLKFPEADTILEKDDYRDMNNVEQLKETLEDEGAELKLSSIQKVKKKYTSATEKELKKKAAYSKARKEWWKLNRSYVGKTDEAFHTFKWEHDGTEYNFHGMVHGSPKLIQLSDEVHHSLRKEAKSFADNFEPVFFEENLQQFFHGISSGLNSILLRELDDISQIEAEVPKIAVLATPLLYGIHKLTSYEKPSKNPDVDRMKTMKRALEEPGFHDDEGNSTYASQPPLKLAMDYHKKLGSNFQLKNLKRSIYMFEKTIETTPPSAEKSNLITGLGHIPDIRYYARAVENGEVPEKLKIKNAEIDQERWQR